MKKDPEDDTASVVHGTGVTTIGRTPHLCFAMQASDPGSEASRHSLMDIDEVVFRRGTARALDRIAEQRKLILYVPDMSMSGTHASLRRNGSHWVLRDEGSKNGTLVNGQLVDQRELSDGDLLEFGSSFALFYVGLETLLTDLVDDSSQRMVTTPQGFKTLDPELCRQFRDLATVAQSRTPVLIRGATGTGKELVARAVHSLSNRTGRFIAVNSGAIPDTLLESELFGHRKGAFSGANHDKEGLVTASDGGTLFLDEVGELSTRAQVGLLRALQEREVMPVGATQPEPVDLRVVAATNRDLQAMVRAGDFREDLWARLNGFALELPSLTQRRMDIGMIANSLLARCVHDQQIPRFTVLGARFLFQYNWPRNIREMERALITATALAGVEHRIDRHHLERSIGATTTPLAAPEAGDTRAQLIYLLETHGGNLTRVADAMGKKRQQIQRWIKRYGIDANAYRR